MTILIPVASYLLMVVLGGLAVFACWRQTRMHLLPLPRLRFGRWTGGEILLAALMLLLVTYLVMEVLRDSGMLLLFYREQPKPVIVSLWASPLILPLSLAGIFYTLYYLSATYPGDLGVSPARWRANIVLGYAGFVLATPLVQILFVLLRLLPGAKPHALVEVGNAQTTAIEWGLMFFTVVIFAPITEELLFRGLLQGWLRRPSLLAHLLVITLIGAWSMNSAMPPPADDKAGPAQQATDLWEELRDSLAATNWGRLAVTTLLVAGYIFWLHRLKKQNLFLTAADFLPPRAAEGDDAAEPRPLTPAETAALARWQAHDLVQQRAKTGLAIFGSAMCFSLYHPAWPDPVALLLLGLVLGWLAQRTQNLLPGMVLHALFNAVAWLTLVGSVLCGE